VKTYVNDRGRPTFTAVKNISLHIENGEFMVLVGPSGCGKSTMLRMVAGVEKITSRTISIGGRVVNELEPLDRGIAMVFENYALYPHMTISSSMSFGISESASGRTRSGFERPCMHQNRLSKDYDYRVETSESMIDLASIRLMLNRIAPV
jgi:ABC-type sugar transport system ATPase subunit